MIDALPVDRMPSAEEFELPSGSVLFHGTLEERSILPARWRSAADTQTIEIFENNTLSSFATGSQNGNLIELRRNSSLKGFLEQFKGRRVFIDYTGLSHHVWMPLLRLGLETDLDITCLYIEPESYQVMPNPSLSDFFDLSAKIRGITPIPTFSKLSDSNGRSPVLVPLLGFEGTRFKYVIETLQPEGQDIIPIIGVPGFKLEFPFYSYRGNADALSTNRAWENVLYSDAACPFSLFRVLQEIQSKKTKSFLQISPIGTKPHALGAAIYATLHPETELVYDHPIRKKQRSIGAGQCHIYYVSEFVRRTSSAAA